MIVVDTNLIAYAVVPGDRTDAALSVLGADSSLGGPGPLAIRAAQCTRDDNASREVEPGRRRRRV